MRIVSAADLFRESNARLQNIESIIVKGNEVFSNWNNYSTCKDARGNVWFMNEMRTKEQLVKLLASYNEEKKLIEQLIEFYENIYI